MEHKTLRGIKARKSSASSKIGKKPRSLAHRLRSVRRVLAGESAVAVGRRYGDSSRAVAYWFSRYLELGEQGVRARTGSGRPSRLSPAQMDKVRAYATAGRLVSGASLAAYILDKFGVSLTRQQCRRILNRF